MASYIWNGTGWVDPGLFHAQKKTEKRADLPCPLIMRDTPEYISPVSRKLIDGRAARREDLLRNNCREVDPSEKPEWNPKTEAQAAAEKAQLDARPQFKLSEKTEQKLKEGK